jgi:hypothetical protein
MDIHGLPYIMLSAYKKKGILKATIGGCGNWLNCHGGDPKLEDLL